MLYKRPAFTAGQMTLYLAFSAGTYRWVETTCTAAYTTLTLAAGIACGGSLLITVLVTGYGYYHNFASRDLYANKKVRMRDHLKATKSHNVWHDITDEMSLAGDHNTVHYIFNTTTQQHSIKASKPKNKFHMRDDIQGSQSLADRHGEVVIGNWGDGNFQYYIGDITRKALAHTAVEGLNAISSNGATPTNFCADIGERYIGGHGEATVICMGQPRNCLTGGALQQKLAQCNSI